jgi:hypothetical protein
MPEFSEEKERDDPTIINHHTKQEHIARTARATTSKAATSTAASTQTKRYRNFLDLA